MRRAWAGRTVLAAGVAGGLSAATAASAGPRAGISRCSARLLPKNARRLDDRT